MSEAEGAGARPDETSAEELFEELRKIQVADIVVQSTAGLVQLGFLRLAGDQLDLAQARLAIDSLKALEPIVREQVSVELGEELGRAIANLQLGYAEAAAKSEAQATEPEASSDEPESPVASGETE